MNQGYRDDLAAAQARIAELEGELAGRREAPALDALEREHAALVRAVPGRDRVRLMTGLSGLVGLTALASMLSVSSPYDAHPRFTVPMQLLVVCSSVLAVAATWLSRVEAFKRVALSERLLAVERARVALESRVRVASPTRVAELDEAEPAESARARAAK